jgi:hypothetical protein
MIKIICVCGARPNFMKIAPVMRAFKANGGLESLKGVFTNCLFLKGVISRGIIPLTNVPK